MGEPLVRTVEQEAPPAHQEVRCAWHAIVRSGDKSIQFQGAPSVTAHVQRGVIGEDFLWGIKTIGAPACLSRVRHHYTVAQIPINKRRVVIAGGNKVLELIFTSDPPQNLLYALEDVFSRHQLPGTKLSLLQQKAKSLEGAPRGIARHAKKAVKDAHWRAVKEVTKMERREKALRRATALARIAEKYLGR